MAKHQPISFLPPHDLVDFWAAHYRCPVRLKAAQSYKKFFPATPSPLQYLSLAPIDWASLDYKFYTMEHINHEGSTIAQPIFLEIFDTLSFKTPLESLIAASWNKGVFIDIPAELDCKKPIELILPVNAQAFILEKITINVQQNARLTLIDTIKNQDAGHDSLVMRKITINVHDDAQLTYIQENSAYFSTGFFNIVDISLGNRARCHWLSSIIGGNATSLDITSRLSGSNAELMCSALYALNGTQQVAINTRQIHEGEETKSCCLIKGFVRDRATAAYHGVIRIEETAHKSQASQENATLVLSASAKAVSIPSLEVLTNDVQCSHGTAIGKLYDEHLFYLQSRGLSSAAAQQFMLEGFFAPLLHGLPDDKKTCILRDALHKL